MKSLILICSVLLLACMMTTAQAGDKKESKKAEKSQKTEKFRGKARVRHVVAFKFKDSATPAQIQEVEKAFAALKTKIPQIVSFEMGTNMSPEKLNKGFTHCFILTFKNAADRDTYLVHPDHKAFGQIVGPVMSDVFVIDIVADKK